MKKIVSLLCLLCSLTVACQSYGYSLSLSPQSQPIGVGETANVDVNLLLNPGEELFGFNFALTYDPAVVEFQNLSFNAAQLQDYITGFTAPSGQDPDLVTFDGALFGFAPITGDITPLASLSFIGLTGGGSPFNLTGSVLDFNSLSEIALNATGNIAPVPEPGTFILLGSCLSGLAFLRKKLFN